jgi:hypothetical protein
MDDIETVKHFLELELIDPENAADRLKGIDCPNWQIRDIIGAQAWETYNSLWKGSKI